MATNSSRGTRRSGRPSGTRPAPTPSLAEHLDEQRERLFKAMSIIACCRLACASLLDQGGSLELMTDALQAAYDLVDVAAEGLEGIDGKGVERRMAGK